MLLHAPVGLATNSEIEENIQIQANYMQFDMETGSSIYEGDVKISQGTIQLLGQKVTILRQQDQIQEINVDGQPARYSQDEDTENKIHATSQHMQYLTDQHRLVMTVDARLEQPDHTIESQRIVYDTKNKIVIAGSDDEHKPSGGRVNITLTPKKDNTTTPANTEKP
ncbi:MAG: lipopolysaccharide transport periplasmic protein LptA [Gammaproteobacteria bacterium]|nr:lipopolysaccharide transport periplasmic protein LptA [Gammaproteobacteria bacterium]